jgi:hypothetical protein
MPTRVIDSDARVVEGRELFAELMRCFPDNAVRS